VEKIKKVLFMLNNFFKRSYSLWDWSGKILYNRKSHRWQYNTAHAHCVLDN